MIRKDFTPKPYIPPSRFPDNRPISREIIKSDDSNLNAAMVAAINTSNPSDILNFFQTRLGANYVDKEKNTPLHFLIMIDDNKLNQQQKIDIIKKLIVEPFNIQIDSPNHKLETPLHIAVSKQLQKVVGFLLEKGADPTKINANHQNAVHIAMIPNIQPCEKKITPDPIINVDNSVEDKNSIYNEALSVFYNDRSLLNPVVEIIKYHASRVEDYFEDYHQSQIDLNDSKIIVNDTPIERSLKDIQSIFTSKLLNSTYSKSEIKKNINYQTIKSVQKISSEYEKFIKSSLMEINLDNRDLLDLSEKDINQIVLSMLSTKKTSIDNIEKQLSDAKMNVLNKIYDQIDAILKILNSNYTWSRKDKKGQLNPLEYAPVDTAGPDPNIINNFINGYSNPEKYYIVRDTRSTFEDNVIGQIDAALTPLGKPPLNKDEQQNVKRGIRNTLFLKDNTLDSNDNQCLNIFIYLYSSHLYSDAPDDDIRDKIIQYYNMLLDGSQDLMKSGSFDMTTPILVSHPPLPGGGHITVPAAGNLFNINTLKNKNPNHIKVVTEINKLLPDHINTLNMWLALDNIKVGLQSNFYNFVPSRTIPNFEFYSSVETPKLNSFLLVENITDHFNAMSKYGLLSDQRGNIIDVDNSEKAGHIDLANAARYKSAIPVGYNAEPTNIILTEGIRGGSIYDNIHKHSRSPNSNPYSQYSLKIINSLTKIGVFEKAKYGDFEITHKMIDNMIKHISEQIIVQNGTGFGTPTITLGNNPSPLIIANTEALWGLLSIGRGYRIHPLIINLMAGQDIYDDKNNYIPVYYAGTVTNVNDNTIIQKIKSRLILAIVEGYVKDRSLVKVQPRKMNKVSGTFIAPPPPLAPPPPPPPPHAPPLPHDNIKNSLKNIGLKEVAADADFNTTITNVFDRIIALGAGPPNYVGHDYSICDFEKYIQLIDSLRRGTGTPIHDSVFEQLNGGVLPADNSSKETEICQKVIRAVMLGCLTQVPDPNNLNPLSRINCIPNSFGNDIAGIDYMNYIKKRFIIWFVQRINLSAPPVVGPAHLNDEVDEQLSLARVLNIYKSPIKDLTNFYDLIENIVKSNFPRLEQLGEANLRLETISVIVKILDRLFINTVKNELYLQSINKLRTLILIDGDANYSYSSFRNRVVKFLNQILHRSNIPIKLDKKIDAMISVHPGNEFPDNKLVHSSFMPNLVPVPPNQQIIDEYHITQVMTNSGEPTEINRKPGMGNYIVHYPMDYNSLQQVSVRQCLYNTTSIIKTLFEKSKQLDYFKLDIHKFSPIFYAVQSKNYLLIKEFVDLVRGGTGPNPPDYSYPIQQQINGHNESAVLYALKLLEQAQIVPEFDMLNVTYINNLLLLADIGRNLPRDYYDMYQLLVNDLHNFFRDPITYDFRNLIDYATGPNKPKHSLNEYLNNKKFRRTKNKLHYKAPLFEKKPNQKSTDEIVQEMNQIILAHKTINGLMNLIQQDKNIGKKGEWGFKSNGKPEMFPLRTATHTLSQHINHIKEIVTIFESRYKPPRLYEYDDIGVRTFRGTNNIKSTNRFFLILIILGMISIRDILLNYYLNLIISTLNTTNIYNFSLDVENLLIYNHTKEIIKIFVTDNVFDMVRLNYLIKLDQYDNISQNQNPVEDFFSKLLDEFSKNGIVQPESQTYNNIKQYINGHMIELVSKTLQYTQVILDVFHRWIVNLYHCLRTYDEITK